MEEKKLPFTGREKIRFNVPPFTGREYEYVRQAVENQKICGDGEFTKKASHWFEERTGTAKCLMTTSCTHATELAAILADIKPGDEIIMPSYTFVSTANAFVLRGGVPVFVDIRPDTMNIDEKQIEAAITEKTKAIVPVHYAGVACEMDTIMDIAKRHNLLVIEDAAQGVMASYKGKALGSIGDYGCYSFHETKNYSMGEGGALLIRDREHVERAEIIRDMRLDVFDVLVGINLLREGLDIPEITLVAILDADKEGFLRSETSLVQTIGRAARNSEGHVIMYADNMTESMEKAISETERRRAIQEAYNREHGITPTTIKKAVRDLIAVSKKVAETEVKLKKDPESMNRKELTKVIAQVEKQMRAAAADLNFEQAAELRDKMLELKKNLEELTE